MKNNFKVIGFDADDTLWINESYYRETEEAFFKLLSQFCDRDTASAVLLKQEVMNLNLYGYGAKGFCLSMLETALTVSEQRVQADTIGEIINLGKELINKPLVLLDGVVETLDYLKGKNIRLIVATKGDLLDQERKLGNSGIEKYFHHIEIMSEKKEENYRNLLSSIDLRPEEFLMIGNSLKSDVLPVLEIGGYGIHVPYHTTWQHEVVDDFTDHSRYLELKKITEIMGVI